MSRCRAAAVALAAAVTAGLTAQQQPPPHAEPQPRLQGDPHEHDAEAKGSAADHLTGDWGGLRSWLAARGVTVELYTSVDSSWVAASGRDPRGTAVRGLLDATCSFDTERLGLWPGGTLFVDFQVQRGDDGSADTGDLQRYSDIDHVHEFEELAICWYDQSFADGQFVLGAGKTDSNLVFDVVPHGDRFVHPSFGHSPNVLAMPTYPDTAFGGIAQWRPGPFYALFGVFDGAAQTGRKTGERGPRTLFGDPEDLFTIGEVGIEWGGAHAGRAGLGAYRHTGEFARFDGGEQDGANGGYLLADARLLPVGGGAERGLGGCLMYGWADPAVSAIEHHVGVGLVWTGPGAERPDDAIGLGASYGRFSTAPGAGLHDDGELAVELTYAAQCTPWCSLQPVVTWIHDPSGDAALDDAWVLTLRTAITF